MVETETMKNESLEMKMWNVENVQRKGRLKIYIFDFFGCEKFYTFYICMCVRKF